MSRSLRTLSRPTSALLAATALCIGGLAIPGAASAAESQGAVIAGDGQQVQTPRERALEGGVAASDPLHQEAVICWIAPAFPWICRQPGK
ncbi:hypothetical protein [Brachybacterium sp. NPDC056505]|uniref:hypothetical protein n=1 Tax=Brachybacterium sp. NPDC056505 TaxID=3345843 RepID=UPI0036706395